MIDALPLGAEELRCVRTMVESWPDHPIFDNWYCNTIRELLATIDERDLGIEELVEALDDVVMQGCIHHDDGTLDSGGISALSEGLCLLARPWGRVEILQTMGRWVIARRTQAAIAAKGGA